MTAVLAWLASGGTYARCLAARHPHTAAATLERLARDQAPYVRRGIARNPATPAQTLEQLAGDREADVRQFVARYTH